MANPKLLSEVCDIFADASALDPSEVRPEGRLGGYGIDSARIVELVLGIEERYGVSLKESDFVKIKTVRDLADHVERMMG